MVEKRYLRLSLLLTALMLIAISISVVNGQPSVYLSLNGEIIPNDGYVLVTDIGTDDGGLLCHTNKSDCCRSSDGAPQGQWYFPDGSQVGIKGLVIANDPTTHFFFRDRNTGVVRLNRYGNPVERGRFRCEVPDHDGVNVIMYVNIGSILLVIIPTSVGTPTAGQTYSLNCYLTEVTGMVTYQWFKGLASYGTQLTNTHQLQFSPLKASDAGLYTCRATVDSVEIEETTTVTITLPAPTSVTVGPPVVPIVKSTINLTCTVELSQLVDVPVTVTTEWTGPAGFMTSNIAQQNSGTPTINYTSTAMVSSSMSGREQTGSYTCKATVRAVSSSLLDSVGYSSSSRVIVVPEPVVSIHSDSPDHVFHGRPPTLTCTVEMTSVVNVSLSMMIVWKGPDGTIIASPTRPEMKSLTHYTSSSSLLTSVDSADSGEYTCTVRFKNGVEISASTNITIVDGVFQLRLKSVGICQQYSESSEKRKLYSSSIKDAIVTAIKHHCECHFPITNLNKDVFICEDSPNVMIYRNSLIGTLNFNGTQIVDFIQDWVNTGPLIEVDGSSMRVDSSCPTAISSLNEPVCGEKKCNDPRYAMCAQHLADNNISNCFEGCVARNG